MNEDLLYYITNHAGSLSVQELLINFFSALVIGFITVSYTHLDVYKRQRQHSPPIIKLPEKRQAKRC